MLYPFNDGQELLVYSFPVFDCCNKLFPNFDIRFGPNQESFKLREKLIDMFDYEGAVKLIYFKIFDILTLLLNQDFVVDHFHQFCCKILGVSFL